VDTSYVRIIECPPKTLWQVIAGGIRINIARETYCFVYDKNDDCIGIFFNIWAQPANQERNFPNNVVDEQEQKPPMWFEPGDEVEFCAIYSAQSGYVSTWLQVLEYDWP